MSTAALLAGRHALVTGAGGGIGAAIARALAGAGARLASPVVAAQPLEAVAATLPEGAAFVVDSFDVTDGEAIAARARSRARGVRTRFDTRQQRRRSAERAVRKTDAELWAHVLAVDLTGVYNVTRAALPDLKRHGSGARLINVASTAGLTGYAYVAAYCAAKHGVIGLTRALALELARSWRHGQRRLSGFHRDAFDRTRGRDYRREDRPFNRSSESGPRKGQSAGAAGEAGRSRRRRALACLARRGVDKRSGDRGRRRGGYGGMSESISAMQAARRPFKDYPARHFRFEPSEDGRVATVRLNRPERKNPLTFDSYAELRDLFRDLAYASDVRAIVLAGAGGNFSLRRRRVRDHRAADAR